MSLAKLPTETKVFRLENPPVNDVDASTWKLSTESLPSQLPPSSVLLQTIWLSNDPAQRGWIQKDMSEERLYRKPVRKGEVMASGALCKVLASTSDKWKVGAILNAGVGWVEYAVVEDSNPILQPIPDGLPSPTLAMSILGGTALTAWFGLHEVGLIKKEDTVLISGAAGSTGSIAVQIAKNIVGCKRVVGIAGGKEKCEYVKTLGADECLDYKSSTFEEDLAKALPEDCEVYFDNVGGSVLNAVLPHVKRFGRVIACGAIATYNDASASVLTNYFEVIANRITIRGFLWFDYISKAPDVRQTLAEAFQAGKIKATGDHETIVEAKFEDIPNIWQKLFTGGNRGKLITKIA
ncbi:NAD(P)-binding protein [Meredithblackwellia eburnea MCA 4105]